ncbi:MAG: cobalt-precorrin-6A reductase [Bradyrhizobium sp.]|uniref:cobalt-precorrin-6A reductase n=1 Tax=Bradyrhizobium sp. TaxID=376 RepID=UPI001C2A22CF|nr:cobalt-precorrin-6A reductase [Bradyrhizobium sp.]MBU6462004.1 cobalt-precorrin-6A reductase [Pseudomonadota bacterium]MDE2066101.1 cobalt-precorrin-6A reductase [Bradyrhizobium sp.]MDE2240989.1 cobalt-precorrin-6A reductase [Bradyrhizobium sp.]
MTSSPVKPLCVLILGGSADANQLASAIVGDPRFDAILSYAGRTENPKQPPIAWRVGGFGGIDGLIDYLRREKIARVVDATHPFAAQMSAHAIAACAALSIPLLALERAPWQRSAGDRWIEVDDFVSAAQALGAVPRRVFLGIGRTQLAPFASHKQHFYLVRLVDQPHAPLPLAAEMIIARGPFDLAGDRKMLTDYRIDIVVARDAGGDSASAKIEAARELGLPVVMVRRPFIPARQRVETVAEVLRWLCHGETPAERGV